MVSELVGWIALITGSGSGIGRETVRHSASTRSAASTVPSTNDPVGYGVIVNMAAITGLMSLAGVCVYATTIALTRTVAIEYRQSGLRINAVCPVRITTALITETMRTGRDAMASEAPSAALASLARSLRW